MATKTSGTKKAATKAKKRVLDSLHAVDESGEIAVTPVEFTTMLIRHWVEALSLPNNSEANASAINNAFLELRTTAQDTLEARGRRLRHLQKRGGRPLAVPGQPSDKTVKRDAKRERKT